MANPTTYFGWVMPNSADLVTDLPADFNVFGQGVDTSMQDLLGGTTGQVLSKTSATNMDFTWVTPQVGDITGVTAGTGITGGGTSGTVTVTNDMATTITTNGDLIYGTGSGTYTRRAIGSTGNVLTVAGGIPTWAAAAAPALVLVKARTTFSAVANTGTTFDSVFTSTYRNYKVVVDSLQTSGGADLRMLYRYGANSQTADYNGGVLQFYFNAGSANLTASGAAFAPIISTLSGDANGGVDITFYNAGNGSTKMPISFTGYGINGHNCVGGMGTSTARSYDGFQLTAASGTISGAVTIYGLAI